MVLIQWSCYMRVFKRGVVLILVFYILSIITDQIYQKKEAEKKFLILDKNNLVNDSSKKRIVIYGSSHCDYGLSAKKITKELKISTLNLCNYGVERKKYSKEFQNKLLNQLNENDLIIYSFRLDLETIQLEEDGILGMLLPQLRVAILDTLKEYLKKDKNTDSIGDFDIFGDRIYYPRLNKPFNHLNYRVNYDLINEDLEEKIYSIIDNENLKSKVMIIIAPILIESKSRIDLNKIKFDCLKNNCDKFTIWTLPIMLEDMKYFATIGPRHFNPEFGRELWTNNVIEILKNLKIND